MDEEEFELVYSNEPKEPCWPFWGNLKSLGTSEYDKHGWNHCFAINEVCNADIFDRFRIVSLKALRMLKRRSISELREAAKEIQNQNEESFEEILKIETEERIKILVNDGGWELNYLPVDSQGTESEIRDLFDNWSYEWEKRDLPDRDDFDELSDLKAYIEFENQQPGILFYLGLVEPEPHEFFALLAMMKICNAIHNNNCSKHSASLPQVKSLAIANIEAIEALAYAELMELEEKIRASIAKKQPEILNKALTRITAERATNAANARHKKSREAKTKVFSWCDENMASFKSMDDAALDIAETFVPQKFRTIREWMTEWKKLRSASTP